ncbi:MAG: flagellar basal-body rod protein FlgG [Phycisphaeraceae bacterium]
MAVVALHSAASGLSALSTELDVLSNNLANVNTTGFKAQRANFESLLYQHKAQPGVENLNGDMRPAGIEVGLGTRIANTQSDFEIGAPVQTGQDLDFFIEGEGFFQVDIRDDVGEGIGYTRAGNFFKNRDGDLVLGNSDGPRLIPPITVPEDATSVEVSQDGTVFAFLQNQVEPDEIGQLELATFVNKGGLQRIGGTLFVESVASGPPITGEPAEGQFGGILQGTLENSNVDPVKELVSLIKTQRAFELNSQTVQAADETLQQISNLRRF